MAVLYRALGWRDKHRIAPVGPPYREKSHTDWRAEWNMAIAEHKARFAALLAEHPTMSSRELARHIGCCPTTALKWKKLILKEQKVSPIVIDEV